MTASFSSIDVAGLRGARTAALMLGLTVGLTAGLGAATGPAQAEKVGVAAAVNPDAFSSLSGTPNKQLSIGKNIFYSERINTTASGLVQVLLLDGSTFTVGPNSDLVIDKFVYDPKKKTGEMIATFSKGTMRFIGGKISKNEGGVTVKTPAGALAIRGGMFQGRVSGRRGTFSFLYGVALTYTNGGHTQTVYEPGYTLDTSSGTPTIRPTTRQDTQFFQSAFSGGGTAIAGGADNQPTNNQLPLTETVSLQDLISDATADRIDNTLEEEEQQTQTQTDNDSNNTNNTNTNDSDEPTTTELTFRVLTPPNTYTAYNTNIRDPSGSGILGGDDNPAVTADDFIWTFSIVNGRLVGTVTGLVDSEGAMSPASVDFPETLECVEGVCPVTGATVTQDGNTTTYEGLAVLRKGFYAYHVIGDELLGSDFNDFNTNALVVDSVDVPQDGGDGPDIILAFGGNGYNFGTPSGRIFGFRLLPDFLQDTFAPFASWESTPEVDQTIGEDGKFIKPQPLVTPLLYKEADGTEGSRPVWLQTSLYINTTPADDETDFDQQSFVNIALGGIDPETGGLIGARRGGASVDIDTCNDGCIERDALAFTGDIASLSGPDGSHFLGTDQPNIVIGLDSTGDAHNIGNDIPLDPENVDINDNTGATYHLGAGLGTRVDPQEQSFDRTFYGYATGIVESVSLSDPNVVASKSPDDFSITFNPDSNTLWANLTVFDVQHTDSATGSYELNFGDSEEFQNRSAYIDNLHYAAIESGAQVSDWNGEGLEDYAYTSATSYLVSGDQLGVTQFFPDTFADENGNRPFCSGCDFIKWGAWGTRVEFGDEGPEYVDNVHLGWWVAGDVTTDVQLSSLERLDATATYNGHALGNVANRIGRADWKTYVAAGDLTMNWNFKPRTGDFKISKFDKGNFGPDGLTFAGPMGVPGDLSNHFGGTISGQLPGDLGSLSGSAAGSFVNNGSLPAAGVIGNWNVKNNVYKATGIFAGSRTPIPGK